MQVQLKCGRSGKYRPHRVDSSRTTRTKKTECPFRINLRRENGSDSIRVSSLSLTHNHDLHPHHSTLSTSSRRLTVDERALALSMKKAGASVPTIRRFLMQRRLSTTLRNSECADDHGDSPDIPHGPAIMATKDVQNALQTETAKEKSVDISNMLNFLADTDRFIMKIRVAEITGCLEDVFWINKVQRQLFSRFPEVLIIDSTFKTNRFNLPLVVMTSIDGNGNSFVSGMALLSREDSESFSWMLHAFVSAHTNLVVQQVQTVITDGDLALTDHMVTNYFPNSKRQPCRWHIENNVLKNLSGCLGSEFASFSIGFQSCMNTQYKEDLPQKLNELFTRFPKSKPYVDRLVQQQGEKFIRCFIGENTNLGTTTTGRGEASNALIKNILSKTSTLTEVVEASDKLTAEYCEKLRLRSFRLTTSSPVAAPNSASRRSITEQEESHIRCLLTPFAAQHVLQQLIMSYDYHVREEHSGSSNSTIWGRAPNVGNRLGSLAYHVKRNGLVDNSGLAGHAPGRIVRIDPDHIYAQHGLHYQRRDVASFKNVCDCLFPCQYCLPCRHSMAVNHYLQLPRFAPRDVSIRWTQHFAFAGVLNHVIGSYGSSHVDYGGEPIVESGLNRVSSSSTEVDYGMADPSVNSMDRHIYNMQSSLNSFPSYSIRERLSVMTNEEMKHALWGAAKRLINIVDGNSSSSIDLLEQLENIGSSFDNVHGSSANSSESSNNRTETESVRAGPVMSLNSSPGLAPVIHPPIRVTTKGRPPNDRRIQALGPLAKRRQQVSNRRTVGNARPVSDHEQESVLPAAREGHHVMSTPLHVESHAEVEPSQSQRKRVRSAACSGCGEPGHTKRTCKRDHV